jgi:hypothetical protein
LSTITDLGLARVVVTHHSWRQIMVTVIHRFILSTLLAVSLLPKTATADWEMHQIQAPPGASTFGESVTISRDGNTGLVSAHRENCTATVTNCGAAYVYVRDGASWRLQARLAASDAAGDRQFGGDGWDDHTIALSADGNTTLIGINPGTNTPKGAVYVFVRNGEIWSEQQKLVRPDPSVTGYDGFGRSVALSDDGNTAVIGDAASNFSSYNVGPGSAYVLARVGGHWEVQAHLTGSATSSPSFGRAVDISGVGGTVAVGSGFPEEAYVFTKRHGKWSEHAILTAADKAINPFDDVSFRQALALSWSGDTVLTGRYIFRWDTRRGIWREEAKLGVNITNQYTFGFTVDMDSAGQHAVVGAWGQGTVFLFHRDPDRTRGIVKWVPERILAKGGGVGSSVAISGDANTILVGYGVYDLRRQP